MSDTPDKWAKSAADIEIVFAENGAVAFSYDGDSIVFMKDDALRLARTILAWFADPAPSDGGER